MALAQVSREHPFPGPFQNPRLLPGSLRASWVCDLGEGKVMDLAVLGGDWRRLLALTVSGPTYGNI